MRAGNWRQAMPSTEAYWMNRVLFDVHHKPDHLQRYLDSPDDYMSAIPLAQDKRAAIRNNDIGVMYLAGVNPYLLRAHCLGLRIPEARFLESLRAVGEEVGHG